MKANRNYVRNIGVTISVTGICILVARQQAEAIPNYSACCDEDGGCTVLVFEHWPPEEIPACTLQGLHTACASPKACCFPDDSCEDIDPICCDDLGGTPRPFTTCAHWNCDGGRPAAPDEQDDVLDELTSETPAESVQDSTDSDQGRTSSAGWVLLLAGLLLVGIVPMLVGWRRTTSRE